LARIKSEYLIPREDSEDPRKELVQIIEKYLHSKKAAEVLEKLEEEAAKFFTNDPSDLIFQFQDKIKIANTKEDLKTAYEEVLLRKEEKPLKIGIRISAESFKIPQKMEEIRKILSEHYLFPFLEFVKRSSCKLEAITYFLALLELSKLGEVATFTDGEEIFVTKLFPPFKQERKIIPVMADYVS